MDACNSGKRDNQKLKTYTAHLDKIRSMYGVRDEL